jgi:hypothetical protein
MAKDTHSVTVTPRHGGRPKLFTGPTQAAAVEAAFAWMLAEHDVVKAARQLLDQLADAREMLEDCNESGKTAAAFAALETATKLAEARSHS